MSKRFTADESEYPKHMTLGHHVINGTGFLFKAGAVGAAIAAMFVGDIDTAIKLKVLGISTAAYAGGAAFQSSSMALVQDNANHAGFMRLPTSDLDKFHGSTRLGLFSHFRSALKPWYNIPLINKHGL